MTFFMLNSNFDSKSKYKLLLLFIIKSESDTNLIVVRTSGLAWSMLVQLRPSRPFTPPPRLRPRTCHRKHAIIRPSYTQRHSAQAQEVQAQVLLKYIYDFSNKMHWRRNWCKRKMYCFVLNFCRFFFLISFCNSSSL